VRMLKFIDHFWITISQYMRAEFQKAVAVNERQLCIRRVFANCSQSRRVESNGIVVKLVMKELYQFSATRQESWEKRS
jgi:hypothetical protein